CGLRKPGSAAALFSGETRSECQEHGGSCGRDAISGFRRSIGSGGGRKRRPMACPLINWPTTSTRSHAALRTARPSTRSGIRFAGLPCYVRSELPRLARLPRRPPAADLYHEYRLPRTPDTCRTPYRHDALSARDSVARRRPEPGLLDWPCRAIIGE